MAITKLTDAAPEEGAYAIVMVFTDEDGDSVQPETLYWSLRDLAGNIVNSRNSIDVTGSGTGGVVTVLLQGDDLAISGTDDRTPRRRFTVVGTYDSDLGSGLPIIAECEFFIDQFVGVT